MSAKIEFNLEDLAAGPSTLKAGDKVGFQHSEDTTCTICVTQDGIKLGSVPTEFVAQLASGGAVHGIVRTVRRRPEDSALLSVTVRCAAGELPSNTNEVPAPEEEEEEDILKLNQEQLTRLADDDKVRWFLRDERLQKAIKDIDTAPNREQALIKALEGPNFKEFANHVLQTAVPDPM